MVVAAAAVMLLGVEDSPKMAKCQDLPPPEAENCCRGFLQINYDQH